MKHKPWQPAFSVLALPLLAASAFAQTTGVAHPDETDPSAQSAPATTAGDHYVMPSRAGSATPAATPAPIQQAYPAQPGSQYTGEPQAFAATGPAPAPVTAAQPAPALLPRQPASTLPPTESTYAPVQTASARPERVSTEGDDSGIVTDVPARPYELPAGTVLKARLDVALGTEGTPIGSPFNAELLADAGHAGAVLLPSGSVLHGRVTAAHGGRRITGGAALRLQPQSVTLPDGTSFPLHATLADVEGSEIVHVNSEGTVQQKTDVKATAAVIGGVTGVAAVTGAVIGGGVGAVVGAGIGVGVGAVVWLKQDNQAHLPAGTTLYFALDEPLQLSPR